ncbi:TEL2-interacting protein 1 [Ceratocystis fimbriata CBS 114723]|uniref:TEL2-interacting protein 1 n=1 Tax=Ceratocystis fimbriata CBS 114723 TaxID=1035309 RepID=A0A2C5XHC8_9PEZI|nr:TEL2-interacting protein 1 [Ceratocystis fimbriata CBS 114723]
MTGPTPVRQTSHVTNAARTEFFQQIKPCCVSISKTASKSEQSALDSRFLIKLVQELLDHLSAQVQRDSSALDKNLADYIFFPLSHIFKYQEKHPLTLIELALRCLTIIIFHGWKSNIEPKLVQQLLLFLTFVIGGVPSQTQTRSISEEATLESLRALKTLIIAAGKSAAASASLVDASGIPALGHAIAVLLDCVSDGKTPEIQVESMKTLCAFFEAVRDDAALASFLPGTVSSLAKVASTPAREKRRVLVSAIKTLQTILVRVLSDIRTRVLSMKLEKEELKKSHESIENFADKQDNSSEQDSERTDKGKVWTPSWLKATAGQVKMALATVLKLAKSDEDEIRSALERLCVSLLDECHKSLDNCAPLLVETAMALSDERIDQDLMTTSLPDLAMVYPELGDSIKVTVYNWATALPRVMQSADDSIKQRAVRNLQRGLKLASAMDFASATLDDAVSAALRDSIMQLIASAKTPHVVDEVETMELLSGSTELATTPETRLSTFRPVIMNHDSQTTIRGEILDLLRSMGSASQQVKLATEMVDYLQRSMGDTQVSAFWLSLELFKAAFQQDADIDAFLTFSDGPSESEAAFHELYTFSVTVLDSHSNFQDIDWRVEALALETISLAASRSKEGFRPELIDVLFPMTSFLGSENVQLRHHAIVGLNLTAFYCGYSSVSELIIANADYMVNSVSLKLNTLSITPTTNKVLQMVVKLAGPRLVPFLDDVVTSIFSALDNYHGYPTFVGSLFNVLNEIVNQGVKSDQLLLENSPADDMLIEKKKGPKHWMTISEVKQALARHEERRLRREKEDLEFDNIASHPKRPWKASDYKQSSRVQEIFDEKDQQNSEASEGEPKRKLGEEEGEEEPPQPTEPEKPPPTPTYAILSKIAKLTQHYLTSPTPALRKSLLSLLATVSPALAPDSTAFLPLVNAVWPVIIQRFYDSEPYITIAACETLSALCSSAGDFMSSRFRDEWKNRLHSWMIRAKKDASAGGQTNRLTAVTDSFLPGIIVPLQNELPSANPNAAISGPALGAGGAMPMSSLGRFAQATKVWEATVQLLVAMLRHIRIEDGMYDEILELLADRLNDEDVRSALETINPDAVWLALYERGQLPTEGLFRPAGEGFEFLDLVKVES